MNDDLAPARSVIHATIVCLPFWLVVLTWIAVR